MHMHMVGVHEPDVIVRWLQRKVGGRGRRSGLRHGPWARDYVWLLLSLWRQTAVGSETEQRKGGTNN